MFIQINKISVKILNELYRITSAYFHLKPLTAIIFILVRQKVFLHHFSHLKAKLVHQKALSHHFRGWQQTILFTPESVNITVNTDCKKGGTQSFYIQ